MKVIDYRHNSYKEWIQEHTLMNDSMLFSLAKECRSAVDLEYAMGYFGILYTSDGTKIEASYIWELTKNLN